MTRSSPDRRARREHATEAFIVQPCSICGGFFVLRGPVTPVAKSASEDEANARARELAGEYEKRQPSRPALLVVTEEAPRTEPASPDDDATLH